MGTKKTGLATTGGEVALARPSWLPDSEVGTEHIGKEDISPPRLTVAQSLHDETREGTPRYIEGLKEAMMFNNMSREIYGNELDIVIVRADPPRYIEFHPRDQGGGVKEMNVPPNDPRTRFQDGKPPVAQKFYDYLCIIYPFNAENIGDQLVSLSFKSTGLKVATRLNYLIKMRRAPLFAGLYRLRSGMTSNKKGTFAEITVARSPINNGWVSKEEPEDGSAPIEVELLAGMFEGLKTAAITYDREDSGGGDAGSDEGDDIPF